MATYSITVTSAWTDSGVSAGKDINLRNAWEKKVEYRVQVSTPSESDSGVELWKGDDATNMHPVKIPSGEKLYVRMPKAGAKSYPLVAVDG